MSPKENRAPGTQCSTQGSSTFQDRNTPLKFLRSAVEAGCSALLQKTSPENPNETHEKARP